MSVSRAVSVPQAKERAAWQVVVQNLPDKSEAAAKTVIRKWLETGLLERFPYTNPSTRNEVTGLRVVAAKRPR